MAERVGFEPTIPVKVCPLSRRIVSTTHAPLRVEKAVSYQPSAKTKVPRFARNDMRISVTPTTNDRRLTTAFKERLQQFGATTCQDSVADFYCVIQLRVTQHLHY
jgi:hypothetical protein